MKVYTSSVPVVSVILPTFNRRELVLRAIESVKKQSFKSWELIIVDDGSTDNTFSILDEYISKYDNIRYIRHRNRGLPLSRNAGIIAASGEYITFIDSDDEFKSDHLELRISFMHANPDTDLVYGGLIINGSPYVADRFDNSKLIHLDNCVVGATFFGRRKVFDLLGGFKNIPYSEDYEFFERAGRQFKICRVDFPTYIYNTGTPDGICEQKLLKYQ